MGCSLSIVIIRGKETESVLKQANLERTGVRGYVSKSHIVGGVLSSQWYLIIANRFHHRLVRDATIAPLSVGCDVITLEIEEHVMVSFAAGWRDGGRLWTVRHDGQNGTSDLGSEGVLPVEFGGIRDTLLIKHQQRSGDDAEVDYVFEIPIELVSAITGYRYDGDSDPVLEVLSRSGRIQRFACLCRWFGKKAS
jgi:hypothetical protein